MMDKEIEETRRGICASYSTLRVADVCDALDALGLLDRCSMSPDIRPVWTDREKLSHRMCGFAMTVRYFPTNQAYLPRSPEESVELRKEWQARVMPVDLPCAEGDVIIIDGAGIRNIGYVGSSNIMRWVSKGARGVVTNAGCRDSDEIAMQRIPAYSAYIGQGRKIGRVEFDQYNVPVSIGGVLVRPGDFIVADGDGVIAVPAEHIEQVSALAHAEREQDLANRRHYYAQLGLPEDDTLRR